jgi:plastocyanin
MNKNYYLTLVFIIAIITAQTASATKITITVANFSFTPSVVNATVGDTIEWVRTSGTHTTTCNGSNGTSLPAGAATWNSPMNAQTTVFQYVVTVAGTYNYVCIPHASNMNGVLNVTAASGINTLTAKANFLEINPPAFKDDAIIKFSLSASAKVQLSIYDFAGRKVETLVNSQLSAGEHSVTWDAANMPQGTFFCRLESADFVITKKFVRIK